MRTRRRKITSETIFNVQTGLPERRFSRQAAYQVVRHGSEDRPAKIVKVKRGKLTGRTKGAFGQSKFEKED